MDINFGDPRLPAARFWAMVKRNKNGCWHWAGPVGKDGYAHISGVITSGGHRGSMPIHRFVYTKLVEELPARRGEPGHLQVDHECHNRSKSCPGGRTCLHRRCVNPAHLRAVTARTNTLAGKTLPAKNARLTHCKHGHEFSKENTYTGPCGRRCCRQCRVDKGFSLPYKGNPANALKTHCIHGHEFTSANTYLDQDGHRSCKRCRIDQGRELRRSKAALLPKKPHYQTVKTHCPKGHAYAGDNLYVRPDGARSCKACMATRSMEHRERKLGRPLPVHQRDWTQCKAGHPLIGGNLYIAPKSGARSCRACRRDTAKARYQLSHPSSS